MRLPTLKKVDGENSFLINWSRCSAPAGAKFQITYPTGEGKVLWDRASIVPWKTGTRLAVVCKEDCFNNCSITATPIDSEEIIEKRHYQGKQSFKETYFYPQKDYENVHIVVSNSSLQNVRGETDTFTTKTYNSIPSSGTEQIAYSTILYPSKIKVTMKLTYGNEILESYQFFDFEPIEPARSILSCDCASPIDNRSFVKYSWADEKFNEKSKESEWWGYNDKIDFNLNPHLLNAINDKGDIDNTVKDFNLTWGIVSPFKPNEDSKELVWSGNIASKFSIKEEPVENNVIVQKITTPEELARAIVYNYEKREQLIDTPEVKMKYVIDSPCKVWNMNGFKDACLTNFEFDTSVKNETNHYWPCRSLPEDGVTAQHYAFEGTIEGSNTILYNMHGCTTSFGALIPFTIGDVKVFNLIIKNSYFNERETSFSTAYRFPYEGIGGFIGAHCNFDVTGTRSIKIQNCGLINCVFDPSRQRAGSEVALLAGYLVGNTRWVPGTFSNILIENCRFIESDIPMAYGGLVGAYQSQSCYMKSYTRKEYDNYTIQYSTCPHHYKQVYVVNSSLSRGGSRNLNKYAHPGWDIYPSSTGKGRYNPRPYDFDFQTGEALYNDNSPYTEHQSYCFDNSDTLRGSPEKETVGNSVYTNVIPNTFFRHRPAQKDIAYFKQTLTQNNFVAPSPLAMTQKFIKKRIDGEAKEVTLTTSAGQTSSIPAFEIKPRANVYLQLPGEEKHKPFRVFVRNEVGEYVSAKDMYIKIKEGYKKAY